MLALLHLCDSLFPIGSFSHSDGLEAATSAGLVADAGDLRQWMIVCLDETLGRSEGPAVRIAWESFSEGSPGGPGGTDAIDRIKQIDAEMHALRPSLNAREASRAMGTRLVRTWAQIHPSADLSALSAWLAEREGGVTLPVAFGIVCAASGIDERAALEGFIYTRLAATISSAMRLMPVGQHEAHGLLAEMLTRAPAVVDSILVERLEPMPFTPALDLAVMSQQYVHSRLFRS